MAVTLIAFAFLAATLINAQTKQTRTATTAIAKPAATAALAQRVELRRAFLTAQEQRRIQIANDLEFSPQVLPRPFPFPPLCLIPPPTPAAAIDPHRSLFVHDRATLDSADFSLRRTLKQIATQVTPAVPGTTAVSIFRQLWDTQGAAPGLVASSPHCTDNGSTINGYPIQCPRAERLEANGADPIVDARMDQYPVLALINRLDLAHQGWRNCGEFRIIYGKGGNGRTKNLIIFEAVLPNPKPGCREGCVPVAEFWKSLSTINSGVARAQMLEKFYYNGLPGFRPVVHVDHYSATGVSGGYGSSGSGQIRTNQFLQAPWTLKEFKTVIDCAAAPCTFNLVPIMVKVNPFPPLWNEDDPHVNGPDFRADTVAQLANLSSGELMKIGYAVDQKNDDGESASQGSSDNYRNHMNAAAAVGFRALLGAGPLTANQIANRALTQSCHGCHQPAGFGINIPGSIGMVLTPVGSPVPAIDRWPNALNFVHVDTNVPGPQPELVANPAAFGPGLGQRISPALLDFFLPDRKNFLLGQLNAPRCTCVPRFRFLTPDLRLRAFDIEAKVHGDFVKRLEEIEKRSDEDDPKALAELLDARDRIIAERDRAFASELAKAGIKLPEEEMLSLRATPVRLTTSAAERTKAVNELVKKEPPRRTVTGTFRAH
jgi:hypothetical protein